MKILIINSVCASGSTGRICLNLAKAAENAGNVCRIAYGRHTFVPDEYKRFSHQIGSSADVRLHALHTRLSDRHGFASAAATKEFISWVREFDPDIIHLHNIHGYYINIEQLFNYIKEANKPVVWTLHDCWSFTGHCAHFDYIGCEKWKSGCYDCKQKRRYPQSLFIDNSRANWQKKRELFSGVKKMQIVTPSYWLADKVKDSFLSGYPVEIINNGIELNIFKKRESSFREHYNLRGKKLILAVSSVWEERKGLDDYIRLSEILPEEYKLIMVGVSAKQAEHLPKSILAIEHTDSQTQLAEIYSAADIFLNLTYEDTYPTVNLEAIACGTPLVTYNSGGSAEIAEENNGIILNDNSFDNITEIFEEALRIDSDELIRLSEKFDSSLSNEKYLKLYSDLYKN